MTTPRTTPSVAPAPPQKNRTDLRSAKNWRLFRGLRIHLAALLASLFCVFYLLTSALIYELTARLTQNDVDAILRDTTRPLAAEVTGALNHGSFPADFVALAKLSQMYPKVSVIVLRDPQGNVIASTAPPVARTLAYGAHGSLQGVATDLVPSQGWYRVLSQRLTNSYKQTTGYLQVGINVDRDRIALVRLRQVLLLVGGFGIAFAAVAGFFLSRFSLRPTVRAWHRQEQFVADASHELRTPLTVMRLNVELMNSRPDSTIASNSESLQAIEEEIHRLHRLTDQLLTLARSDSGFSTVLLKPVDVSSMIARAVALFRLAAEAKGLTVQYTIQPAQPSHADTFTVLGDADKLYQLFTIFLDNAVKYTNVGGIDVLLARHRHEVIFSVQDSGIGIDVQHLESVFDRFYRTDAARSKGHDGTGLGLAIARAIVTAHRGRVTVQSVPGKGTTFRVSLPAAPGTR